MIKLSNLSMDDINSLKNMYFIQEIPELRNQRSCENEIKFIIEMRQRIYKLLLAAGKTRKEQRAAIDGQVCELAEFINGYLANDDYKAITRKMLLVEHFKSEIEQINGFIQQNDRNNELYDTKDFCASLELFLTKTAHDKIKERASKDELVLSREVYDFLAGGIKQNFMDNIDQKNLTSFDFYLLMGELLKNRESAYENLERIQKTACDACGREDCMLPTKCGTIEEKDRAAAACDRYDNLLKVIKQKLRGEPINDFARESAIAMQRNKKIKEIAESLLDDNYTEGVNKHMVFYSPSERIVFLPKLIQKFAEQEVGEVKDVGLLTADKVAALGVENTINFGGTNGEDVVERFGASGRQLQSAKEKLSESELQDYNRLIKTYMEIEKSK